MNSENTTLFKNKGVRTAHFAKGGDNASSKKVSTRERVLKSLSEDEEGHPENISQSELADLKIVASGDVRNKVPLLPLGVGSSQESITEGAAEVDGSSHIKLKLNVGETNFYNLKPRSKTGELNEDLLFARNLRRSVKFNDELKRQSQGPKRVKKSNIEKEKALCFGSLSDPNVKWTFDTPAPKELVEIHRRIFNLDEESGLDEGPNLFRRPDGTIMDWDYFLTSDPKNLMAVPPVTSFKWAPFGDIWDEIAQVGLGIELRNPFTPGAKESYWIGTIVHYAGYRALVKFESFDLNTTSPRMAWISFCSDVPKPLGWCKENKKRLSPGPIVGPMGKSDLQNRIQEFSQRPTISPDHFMKLSKVLEKMQQHWNVSVPVEAMDIRSLHQNRLARITAVVGDRVNISYYAEKEDDYNESYWFHYQSEGLHQLYWSQTVGMVLNGVSCAGAPDLKLPDEVFNPWPADKISIQEGMKLEALHPYHINKLVGAVVVKVLNCGYFEIQTREVDTFGRLHFVYHITSPYVLPWGFGSKHGIEVDFEIEEGTNDIEVDPEEYLNLQLLPPRPEHNFVVGDKLEAFDLNNTSFIGPVTIKKIAGHLLLIHFDNWREIDRNFQWVDAQSTEIYPVGYAQMLGIKWQSGV